MGLQEVTAGYKGLEGVRVGYNKQLGNYASHTEQKLISFKKVSRSKQVICCLLLK